MWALPISWKQVLRNSPVLWQPSHTYSWRVIEQLADRHLCHLTKNFISSQGQSHSLWYQVLNLPHPLSWQCECCSFPQHTSHFLDVLVDLHLWKLYANVLESVRGCFTNSQDTTVYQFLAPHWPHLLTPGPCSASFHVQTWLTQTHGTGAMLLTLTPFHGSFCMHLKRCLPTEEWMEGIHARDIPMFALCEWIPKLCIFRLAAVKTGQVLFFGSNYALRPCSH